MSKSNIITVAAIAVAAYFLFFRKDGKKNNTTENNTTENNTTTEVIEWPEPPVTEPLIETTETKEPCPYCGTPNAIVKRTYRDGQLTQQSVACGNKSCPGPVARKNKNTLSSSSGKIHGAD